MKKFLIALLKVINIPRVMVAYSIIKLAHVSSIVEGDMKRLDYRYSVANYTFLGMLMTCLARDHIFQTILDYRLTASNKVLGYIYRMFFQTRRKDIEIWSKIEGGGYWRRSNYIPRLWNNY